jgi:hypothetical protein
VLDTNNNYQAKFLDLAVSEGFMAEMSVDDLPPGTTREDLGLSSLNVILLIANYIEQNAGDVEFDPAWVDSLADVEGIASVLRRIDDVCAKL